MKLVRLTPFVAVLFVSCGSKPIDPVALGRAVAGTIFTVEQVQLTEAALYLQDPKQDPVAHCTVQRVFGEFAKRSEQTLTLVFDRTKTSEERLQILSEVVRDASVAVEKITPRLSPTEVILLRAAITAGTVAILAVDARRMPVTLPPELEPIKVSVAASLARMQTFTLVQCPT